MRDKFIEKFYADKANRELSESKDKELLLAKASNVSL